MTSPGQKRRRRWVGLLVFGLTLQPGRAEGSFLSGDALDTMANAISWVALFLVPAVGIGVFWFVHILPEKVAHKRRHPQAKAIQCLCFMSLVFGGLLWPLALLWAYSKPVFYKLAYGTDVADEESVAPVAAKVAASEEAAVERG